MTKASAKVILQIGDKAPDFTLRSHNEGELNLAWYQGRKNVVLAFYPGDFTAVCGIQIPAYQKIFSKFEKGDCQILGISCDSLPCHIAWAKSLGHLSFPLMSDFYPHGEVSIKYGVFDKTFGCPERAVFLIDKKGIIRYIQRVDAADLPDNKELLAELARL